LTDRTARKTGIPKRNYTTITLREEDPDQRRDRGRKIKRRENSIKAGSQGSRAQKKNQPKGAITSQKIRDADCEKKVDFNKKEYAKKGGVSRRKGKVAESVGMFKPKGQGGESNSH